jgi:GNAT superfamily N-acetyltransferase
MLITVRNKNQLIDFINLPDFIYSDDPNWVKPKIGASPREFNVNANPALRYHNMELYLVTKGKNIAGRIAAFVDKRYNSIHGEKTAFFGFFESQDNIRVASELFTAAVRFAKSKGMTRLIGPVEFTTNYQAGILVEGFGRPTVMTPYNKEYYPKLLESNGFTKLIDLYAYNFANPSVPDRLARMSAIQEQRNPNVKVLNFRQAGRLCNASVITKLYNQAFCDTWGFVPMSTKEFSFLLHSIVLLDHWDLNYLAFYDDTPVGLLLTVPDLYAPLSQGQGKDRNFKDLRVTVLGVLPSFRTRGIEARLGTILLNDAMKKGYKNLEFSFILENNTAMNNYVNREFGIPAIRTFRIYEKPVPNN